MMRRELQVDRDSTVRSRPFHASLGPTFLESRCPKPTPTMTIKIVPQHLPKTHE